MTFAKLIFVFFVIIGAMLGQTTSQGSLFSEPRGFVRADSMKCDGHTDDTMAFDAVIRSAFSGKGPLAAPIELLTVQLPSGECRFAASPQHIPAGIKLLGNSNRNGTWLIADYNETKSENGFLTWDSSFDALGSGVGGGIEHVHISKGSGKTGGTAIKLSGTDDSHRAGFMLLNDLYINSAFGSPGYWHHHLIADGSCCTTSGSNGIRDIMLTNFHFGPSRPPREGESILIVNGVHIHILNGVIFSSQGGGIKIPSMGKNSSGASNDVLMSNVQVEGTLILDGVEGFVFSGWLAGRLSTSPSSSKCYVVRLY